MKIHTLEYLYLETQTPEMSRVQMYGPGGSRCVVGSDVPTAHVNKEPCGRLCSVSPRSSRIFFLSTDASSIRP